MIDKLKTIPLSRACDITTGRLDSNHAEAGGIYPFFTCAPDPLKINTYAFDGEVILIAGNNAQGNFHINKYNGKFNAYQRTYILTEKQGYCLDFIYYSLKLELVRLKKKSQGSQTKFLTKPILENIQIDDIGIKDQQKIASILAMLDAKIELNNKVNASLESMLETLYKYWFVQFDFPNKDGKPYKSNGGEMVWNDELKKEIPKGWSSANLLKNSFTEIIKPGIKRFEGFKEYLATADINGREIGKGSDITFEDRESRANMQPVQNSIWFAKMKAGKKHLFIGEFAEDIIKDSILSTGFMGLKCDAVAFEFLAGFISSNIFEVTKDKISHGATMQGVSNDDLKFIKIIIPDEQTLLAYGTLTRDLYKEMDIRRRENKQLSELRDWLLLMLMNGQVTVK